MRQLRRWKRLWWRSLTGSHNGVFQKLMERYNKCVAAGGDYFEGDKSFMSVLWIKVLLRKKSWNLSYAPRNWLRFLFKRRQCKNESSFKRKSLNDLYLVVYISKVGDHSRGWPEGSLFDSLLHQGVGESATPFPGLLHFPLDPYLIMLSVKQGGIKYHFLSLWYDSTWDWTQVSRAIGEHSNR